MLKHYIIQALRSFWRFRVTAGVNLLGLVLAVVCFVASYLYVDSLVRTDRQFPNASRTWLLTQELWNVGGTKIVPGLPAAGPPAGKYLKADFPGLEAVARAIRLGPQSAAADDRKADVNTAAVDPEFLKIFALDFKAGEPAAALTSAHSAILTERTAERLFGTRAALGQRILLQNQVEVTVTGVIAAIPQPSHMGDADSSMLQFDILVPMQLLKEMKTSAGIGVPIDPDSDQAWGLDSFLTYLLFRKDGSFTPRELIEQLPAFAQRRANRPGAFVTSVFGAVPLSHAFLAEMDAFLGGNVLSVTTMIFALDALILAIACINYANLAVAIATTRAKELGVRKVLGATRLHLIRQCLVEAALLGIAAVILVIVLAVLLIEPVNRALQINLTFASLLQPQLWLMVIGLIGAISLMGGMYPAVALARVRPVDALRAGSVQAGPRLMPTILVGVQFAAASFLLVVALVMAHQNGLLKKQALQAAQDPIVVLDNDLNELGISFDTLREELLRSPAIKSVATNAQLPWNSGGNHETLTRGAGAGAAREDTIMNDVGYHFFETMDLQLLAGRLLDREHGDELVPFNKLPAGRTEPIVIDRALAAALGWQDPNEAVNKIVYVRGAMRIPFRVVGVVENGYPRLVGPNTASNAYDLQPSQAGLPLIRISREHVTEAVKYIDSTWDRLAPKVQIRRKFSDALFDDAYRGFSTINSTLNGLSAFAFLIAIMGLSGLAIHVTTRRRREIGIRKTLGATAREVVTMLLLDFAKPVLVANLIAWPFAWFVGYQYMDKFTVRGTITIWPFILSLLITVGVAWASVAFQALRAATVKPANVLYVQ